MWLDQKLKQGDFGNQSHLRGCPYMRWNWKEWQGLEGIEAEAEEGGATGIILRVGALGEILGAEGRREMGSEEDGEVIVIVGVEEGGMESRVFRKLVRFGRSSSLSSSDTGSLFRDCFVSLFAIDSSFEPVHCVFQFLQLMFGIG